jgi:hypothetical protein
MIGIFQIAVGFAIRCVTTPPQGQLPLHRKGCRAPCLTASDFFNKPISDFSSQNVLVSTPDGVTL